MAEISPEETRATVERSAGTQKIIFALTPHSSFD
jgi:hypothetical protein